MSPKILGWFDKDNQAWLLRFIWLIKGVNMKIILCIIGFCFYLGVPAIITAQPQKGADYQVIDHAHVAVILIDYPDTKYDIRDLYPSKEEIGNEIFSPTGKIQRYFEAMSYTKFQLSGEVFGLFTHQDSISAANNFQSDFLTTITTIQIPRFQFSDYTHFVFISYNDYVNAVNIALTDGIVTINDMEYTLPVYLKMTIQIGHLYRNPSYPFVNSFRDIFGSQIFVPLQVDPFGEIDLPNYTGITSFQRTFLHEMIHALGIWVHAYSKTNGNRYFYEAPVNNNYDFLNREYGNVFDIMGVSWFGFSLNGGYRDLLGWTDEVNRIKIDKYSKQRIRLYPINRNEGYRICEIRIPYKYSPFGYKNQGYFLEVHENDEWDSTLTNININDNTKGIILLETDGYQTSLLDASPSSNLDYNWGSYPDLRDVALRPGMSFRDTNNVAFTNIEKNDDGSFSLDIEILDSTAVSAIDALIIGDTYFLEQNYPNPFNPSTTIQFTLPKSEIVELKVYNILGKEVTTLVSNKLNQGNHTYQFDGRNLASGVYYYQLVAGEFSKVKKMILIK
jgi:hypothetical protein